MKVILILITLVTASAYGSPQNFAPIGLHYPIFVFEKSENPENILIPYVKLNSVCQFEADPKHSDHPLLDFYWLMGGKKYKPVHSLIKGGIADRLEVIKQEKDKRSFTLRLTDLSELKHDLKSTEMTITAAKKEKDKESCQVNAVLTLGPSQKNRAIILEKIYTVTKKTFTPPFREIKSVTVTGVAVDDGSKITHKYLAN